MTVVADDDNKIKFAIKLKKKLISEFATKDIITNIKALITE